MGRGTCRDYLEHGTPHKTRIKFSDGALAVGRSLLYFLIVTNKGLVLDGIGRRDLRFHQFGCHDASPCKRDEDQTHRTEGL